jgi:SAM-dependent methyltransferase
MSKQDKEKWNKKYQVADLSGEGEPREWLEDNIDLLNGQGKALDIATGLGKNAVFLANLGYHTLGIDISEAGLEKACALAKKKNVRIETLVVDLDSYRLKANEYDLILCFYFLDRKLFPKIQKALKPGGLVFYETFNLDHLKYTDFKKEWVLGYNELLQAFSNFRILRYREIDQDEKGFTSLVARKPAN